MPEPTVAGRILGGRYRLDRELARGGMATVWVAEDPLLSRRVAVKLLLPQLAVDDALRVRFRNEAIAAAKLTHPGIVATYDTGDDDGTAYIVMELVEGTTLRRVIDERERLPVRDAVDISSQVADALEHAHRQGLVHRDIKPANVLVQPDGRVKVTDFGIAKAAGGDDLTRTGTVVGTARYLAPEQVNGHPVDGRADVYALGLILYEMLAG
ncbi:MAG TPA: protein kinase, partial [Acidimicrobiia bacterium]|nr:protein kinase [Acidimicrobiia bacterium]